MEPMKETPMKIRPAVGCWIAGALAACAAWAPAAHAVAPGERTGKEVVDTFCFECHGTGANGAPKIGDAKAWKARAARGLTSLTTTALAGVRKMPPHGGTLAINDLEIKRAITYMINKSGGHWNEPIDRAAKLAPRGGEQIVQAQCVKCHGTGEGGAPRLGDRAAWIKRAQGGFDSLVASAIHGHGGMPSRGGMADLTDAELRGAVTYMFQTSVKEGK
jgi:cytochrome c5